MFMTVKINTDNFLEFNEEFLDITEIVLDNEWKQSKIKSLKKTIKETKEEGSHLIDITEIQTVDTEDCYLCAFKEKNSVIIKLETQLHSENLNPNLYVNSNHDLTGNPQKPSQHHIKKGKNHKEKQIVDSIRSEDVESSEPFMNQWKNIIFWYLYLIKS